MNNQYNFILHQINNINRIALPLFSSAGFKSLVVEKNFINLYGILIHFMCTKHFLKSNILTIYFTSDKALHFNEKLRFIKKGKFTQISNYLTRN